MSWKERMYHALVNRVIGIQERYKKARNNAKGAGRVLVLIYLMGLNISYYIFRNKKLAQSEKNPFYEKKKLFIKDSESSLSKRETPEKLALELAKYDVISFDVFDTLVLRPFSSPTDLFFLLGERLGYFDFKRIRMEIEWKTREKKYKKEKHYEINLDEIYTLLSAETGIDKEQAMKMEEELEYSYCYANPYMYQVVEELKKLKKKMIITSDMYLNTEQIKELLRRCGYSEFSSYYVSCDMVQSKSKGDLFDTIKNIEGKNQGYAHIGDNYIADIEQAKKHGFTSYYYANVNAVGMPYRPEDMSAITGGIYRGMVNAHIHNGLMNYSREYEYGYIYGGLFVTGYCQFIHKYVEEHQVDKILFLARDGDILAKAYVKLYPDEKDKLEYVYWSRVAATKMAAKYYKYDYFRRFLYHKVNQQYTLKQIFSSMELLDMLSECCEKEKLTAETQLTVNNVSKVKAYLQNSWVRVLEHYEEQLIAGKQYYGQVLKDCKNAVAVDIGWAGSGAVTLNYIVNDIWKLDCNIVGMIAGTNTCHDAEPDASETFLQTGKLVSYLYSQRENRDIWKLHNSAQGHNLYWEILLDAPMGSFKGFYLNEQGIYECRFKETDEKAERIEEVQKGILDFTEQFQSWRKVLGRMSCISGRDAYAPMVNIENQINKGYMKKVEELMDDVNI